MKWFGIIVCIPIVILVVAVIWIKNPIKSFKQARKSYRMVIHGEHYD